MCSSSGSQRLPYGSCWDKNLLNIMLGIPFLLCFFDSPAKPVTRSIINTAKIFQNQVTPTFFGQEMNIIHFVSKTELNLMSHNKPYNTGFLQTRYTKEILEKQERPVMLTFLLLCVCCMWCLTWKSSVNILGWEKWAQSSFENIYLPQ